MDIHTYIKGAIETESKIKQVESQYPVDLTLLIGIEAGEIVDMVKKHIFYKRKFDIVKWTEHLGKLGRLVNAAVLNGEPPFAHYDTNPRLFHAAVGIFTEGAELLEAINNAYKENKPIDQTNFREENGDVEWYQAIAYDEMKIDPEDNFQNNHTKLDKIRYKNKGFTVDSANNRNLEAEQQVLENLVKSKPANEQRTTNIDEWPWPTSENMKIK